MIIDGKEVLYTIRNGKIVDPNIPTDGLVCYLDTRGKYNTDVYRNTLLDLSGDGNHGTLQNFNFTEESGYVKDLSGEGTSGLKFDGIDDLLDIKYLHSANSPHTVLIDFYLPEGAKEQGSRIFLTMGFYIHNDNNFIYRQGTTNPIGTVFSRDFGEFTKGRHRILMTYNKDLRDSTYFKKDTISKFHPSNVVDSNGIPYIFNKEGRVLNVIEIGRKTIYSIGLWNRALTDTEIQQLMEV